MMMRTTHIMFVLAGLAALAACTPPKPKMSVEDAMVACRADVANPVRTRAGVGLSVGSGGKVRPSAGVGISVDVSSLNNPQKAYENCVRRNSGELPTEEF